MFRGPLLCPVIAGWRSTGGNNANGKGYIYDFFNSERVLHNKENSLG
jgi:hypothetical protein